MKLSDQTLKVLKNFSTFNSNIVIEPGQEIRSRNETKTIGARYRCPETFEKEIALFSLNEFISIYGIFKDPEITLEDKYLTLSDQYGKQKVIYANKAALTYADRIPGALTYNCEFDLSSDLLARLKQAIAANGFEFIAFNSTGGRFSIIAGDLNKDTKDFDPSSNLYTIDVDGTSTNDFNIVVATNDLIMLNDTYKVGIFFNEKAKIVHFYNETIDYWISMQKFSRFG